MGQRSNRPVKPHRTVRVECILVLSERLGAKLLLRASILDPNLTNGQVGTTSHGLRSVSLTACTNGIRAATNRSKHLHRSLARLVHRYDIGTLNDHPQAASLDDEALCPL